MQSYLEKYLLMAMLSLLGRSEGSHGLTDSVIAPNHQHLFSVRIDPNIDGEGNTLVQEDSVSMPFDKSNPPADNKWGVGYVVEKTPITTSGWADADPFKNRVFKM
jgi:primary-amine oxidase